jgi:endogenous inhibitor of DNA gyrase (YacG/DUF329 family)
MALRASAHRVAGGDPPPRQPFCHPQCTAAVPTEWQSGVRPFCHPQCTAAVEAKWQSGGLR